jgi:hypothetical protein
MILDFYQINNEIWKVIHEGKPASVLRIDNTMGYILDSVYEKKDLSPEFFGPQSFIQGGIYPLSEKYYLYTILPKIEEAINNSNCLGFADSYHYLRKGNYIKQFKDKKLFMGEDFLVMDPGAILSYSNQFGELKNPWTTKLKDKKVLVISTHSESIKHQWKNIDKVWGSQRERIVPFELVDVIRSPYHPDMDNRQPPNCDHWLDSVNYIKELMDTYDYDILLSGCSTSSPLYCDHAKQMGKIGIQTGGTIQIFFGILGYRWTKGIGYENWKQMFNEHWINPLQVDEPQNRQKYISLETNFAYW